MQRFDPYKTFRFRIAWDGHYVAGLSKMSALKRSTEVIAHREGGDASSSAKVQGRSRYDAVTLERGVTHDADFEAWARQREPRDLSIDVFDAAGNKVRTWRLFRCWVSLLQAHPELDADAKRVAIEKIRIEAEVWTREDGSS